MMRTAIASLALAGGCGRILFDPAVSGNGTDGNGSTDGGDDAVDSSGGGTDARVAGSCVPATSATCDFNGPGTCSCWGSPVAVSSTVTESGGHLTVQPAANTSLSTGGCNRTGVTFGAGGVVVEVSATVATSNGVTALQLGMGADLYQIAVDGTTISSSDGSNMATAGYDAGQMRFWRIRPAGSGVTFETSPDGLAWSPFAMTGRTPSSTYDVRITGGTVAGIAAPTPARFESIGICP